MFITYWTAWPLKMGPIDCPKRRQIPINAGQQPRRAKILFTPRRKTEATHNYRLFAIGLIAYFAHSAGTVVKTPNII